MKAEPIYYPHLALCPEHTLRLCKMIQYSTHVFTCIQKYSVTTLKIYWALVAYIPFSLVFLSLSLPPPPSYHHHRIWGLCLLPCLPVHQPYPHASSFPYSVRRPWSVISAAHLPSVCCPDLPSFFPETPAFSFNLFSPLLPAFPQDSILLRLLIFVVCWSLQLITWLPLQPNIHWSQSCFTSPNLSLRSFRWHFMFNVS